MGIGRRSLSLSGEISQTFLRFCVYVIFAVTLMALDHRGQYLKSFHALVREATSPVLMTIQAPVVWFGRAQLWSQGMQTLIEERDRLRVQVAQLEAQQLEHTQLRSENEELKTLVGLTQQLSVDYLTAKVVSVDLNPFAHRVFVDVGSRDGVSEALAVVDKSGLIGQVDSVANASASVILITDPDHALPVRIARTGQVTVAYGGGLNSDLRMADLPMNVDLVEGDLVLTSGLGGVFPAGLPVAQISGIQRLENQTFALATATPLAELERSSFVVVLQPRLPNLEPASDDAGGQEQLSNEPPGAGDG